MNPKILLPLLWIATAQVRAEQLPQPDRLDARVRHVLYRAHDVTVIDVQRGTATRIVLAEDERIIKDGSSTGFAADCSEAKLEWCIRADAGSNQVLVKPKEGATHNNLELRTDKRDYSFAFRVLPDRKVMSRQASQRARQQAPMHRVVFTYPSILVSALQGPNSEAQRSPAGLLATRMAAARPKPRNWRYSLQALPGAADIVPSLVFDDGRFTYFRFPSNRELPTIFFVSPTGEEARINFHMDATDSDLAVVERLGRRFVLRLGSAAVGIWNEGFDSTGVPVKDGTTVDGVARDIRAARQP